MKKMQQAHSALVLRQTSIPDIKVTDVSSPTKTRKCLDPDKLAPKVADSNGKVHGTNHMSLPTSHVELKSHFHPLKATQSQCAAHHAPTIAEQGKHVYHSEPANLNGFVQTSPDAVNVDFLIITAGLTHDDAFSLLLAGMAKTITANQRRLAFAQSCEGLVKVYVE